MTRHEIGGIVGRPVVTPDECDNLVGELGALFGVEQMLGGLATRPSKQRGVRCGSTVARGRLCAVPAGNNQLTREP